MTKTLLPGHSLEDAVSTAEPVVFVEVVFPVGLASVDFSVLVDAERSGNLVGTRNIDFTINLQPYFHTWGCSGWLGCEFRVEVDHLFSGRGGVEEFHRFPRVRAFLTICGRWSRIEPFGPVAEVCAILVRDQILMFCSKS